MRINHNIAALNTYNKLSANQAQTAKSLEKLSSGLKINKAGDDAAGLAISEKMRGQIRGLDQASANASDGISLIKTAEGGLNETHSILQRMRELAVQSANDTNVGVDRGEIQKEMNQLTNEINRIGNTTEFNTKKLLNGGGIEKAIAVTTTTAGAGVGSITGGDDMATADVAATWNNTIVAASGTNAAGNSGTVSFNGATIHLVTTVGTTGASGVDSGTTATSVTVNMTSGAHTATEMRDLIKAGFEAMKSATGSVLSDFTFASGATDADLLVTGTQSLEHNDAALTVGSGTLALAAATATTTVVAGSAIGEANFAIDTLKTSKAGVAQVNTSSGLSDGASGSTQTFTFKGVSVNVTTASGTTATDKTGTTATSTNLTVGSDMTDNDFAAALASAFDSIKTEGGADSAIKDFNFTSATNTLVMTAQTKTDDYKDDELTRASGVDPAVTNGTITTAGVDEVRGEFAFSMDTAFEAVGTTIKIGGETFTAVAKDATGDQFNVGTDAEEQAANLAKAMNSNETLSARFDTLVDGTKITLREKAQEATGTAVTTGTVAENKAVVGKSEFTVDDLVAVGGKYEVDGVKIEVTDDASHEGLANGTAVLYDSTQAGQASKLTAAINANSTLNAKYETATVTNNTIQLTQKAGEETMEATEAQTGTSAKDGFQANFQIGANTAQSLTVAVDDMRSAALKVAGSEAGGAVTAKDGATAKYLATKDITDGTTNTGVEYALDVSSHEKATAAISVINDAIESVSAERSKMGSFQNRLEHTINNLSTSSENMTSADSRIRDVDMAKEMMEFTKNNILSQAAQSMLAQANQQPQGVLQLLQ